MSEGHYDVAQICLNGHVINAYAKSEPSFNQNFCDKCGQPTLTQCEQCNTEIRGKYVAPGYWTSSELAAPSYCHNFGATYPWTQTRLEVARELIEEFDELDEVEREQLKESLPDIVRETPRTELAGRRWKRILGKLGQDGYEAIRSILVDIASETTKETLFGP